MDDSVSIFLNERISAGDFPSAVYLVGRGDEIVLTGALGDAVVQPEKIEATFDTIYDVASLTKPLVTGLLAAIFIERGGISLDDRVSAHLGEFDVDAKRMITVRDLVAHTSHLPAWLPFYLLVADPAEIIGEIGRTDVAYGPEGVIYGDPNFIVLGMLLERLAGLTLDELAAREIFGPLGLKDTQFNPPADKKRRIAASELGNRYERQICVDQGYQVDEGAAHFRNDLIWGEVHDGNAYFMRGVAGHAGLFSTAEEIFILGRQFLPRTTRLLSPDTCGLFRQNFTAGMNEARSFAFQLASTPDSTAGRHLSPKAFGHLGFTGTSIWIDPVGETVYVLLTNRTHAHDLPFVNINSVRRTFHELACRSLDEK